MEDWKIEDWRLEIGDWRFHIKRERMSKIERFEDLEVWKLSMELCTDVYKLTNSELFSKDFGLKDQIRRSSVSIPSNISEGYEREGKNQFLYFLAIAKGSCGELRTQLKIAHNIGYLDSDEFEKLNEKCVLTSKQIKGFSKYLKDFKSKK